LNLTDYTVRFGIAGKTSGWVALGVSTSTPPVMVNSEAMIGWRETSSTKISMYRLNAKDSDMFSPIDSTVPLSDTTSCEFVEGGATWTAVWFKRSLSSGSNPINYNSETPLVLALGPSDSLVQHSSGSTEQITLNLATGEVKEFGDEKKALDAKRLAHAILMFVAFGAALPAGVIFARFGKQIGESWVLIHASMQVIGYFVGFAGFVVALIMVNRVHFTAKPHAQIGLSVLVSSAIQLAIGFFRPQHVEKGQPKPIIRLLWEIAHTWFGRIVLITSAIAIFFGFRQIEAHIGFYIAYGVYLGILVIVIIALEIRSRALDRREKRALKDQEDDDDL
jgi:hypothetical protein